MSFSNYAENAVLNQVFIGTALPWNANSNLWIALHTADPGEIGTAITSEANYTSYARVQLTRASDFTVTDNVVSNANLEQFVAATGGNNTITYTSIVTTASGPGEIVVRAVLNSPVVVSSGVQPQFAPGSLTYTLD